MTIWFARYAYVRWTTPPAIVAKGAGKPLVLKRNPREAELSDAIRRLTFPVGGAAWAGVDWQLARSFSRPRAGLELECPDWLNMLASQRLASALDRVARASLQHRDAVREADTPFAPPPEDQALNSNEYGGALLWLTLRARQRHEVDANFAGALDDLLAAMYLAERQVQDRQRMPGFPEFGGIPRDELACFAASHAIPFEPARKGIEGIRAAGSLSVGETLRARLARPEAAAALDRCYTDDGHGDGWLVLSAAADMTWGYAPMPSPHGSRSEFWNLFSPLFYSRREMAERLGKFDRLLSRLDELDFKSADAQWRGLSERGRRTNVRCGPLAFTANLDERGHFYSAFSDVARCRAGVILLALSAYRQERGEYPPQLADLAPRYLEAVPLDPITWREFRYERRGSEDFDLGSHGRILPTQSSGWWQPSQSSGPSYKPQRDEPAELLTAEDSP